MLGNLVQKDSPTHSGETGQTQHQGGVKAPGYRGDIDGLRAVAIVSVLLFHAGCPWVRGGFVGVDVFFVISGFLIGGHIYSEELKDAFSFSSFYARRAKRIMPALLLVLITVLLMGTVLLSPLELRQASTDAVAAILSSGNIWFWKTSDYFAVASEQRTLLMTWSLGIEEQFYIFVPLLMVVCLRRKIRLFPVLLILAVLSLALSIHQVSVKPIDAFYLLPSRAWELLVGVMVALIPAKRYSRESEARDNLYGALGLALVIGSVILFDHSTRFPGFMAVPVCFGAALLIRSRRSFVNEHLLNSRLGRAVGRISYSLYLWHWPLFSFSRILLGGHPSSSASLMLMMVSIMLSIASYRYVEQPFRHSRLTTREALYRYGIASLACCGICCTVWFTFGLQFRSPVLAAEERLDRVQADPCRAMSGGTYPNLSARCLENTGRPALVLLGDSHAAALAPSLRDRAHHSGFDFVEMTKSSCPPLMGVTRYFREDSQAASECSRFNKRVFDILRDNPRLKVVFLTGYWKVPLFEPYTRGTGWLVSDDQNSHGVPSMEQSALLLKQGIASELSELLKLGKIPVIAQDVPMFAKEPLWRIRTSRLGIRRWIVQKATGIPVIDPGADEPDQGDAEELARHIISETSSQVEVQSLDLQEPLCRGSEKCLYRIGSHSLYADNQHLTPAGAEAALGTWAVAPAESRVQKQSAAR